MLQVESALELFAHGLAIFHRNPTRVTWANIHGMAYLFEGFTLIELTLQLEKRYHISRVTTT